MQFGQAITTCLTQKYVDFTGRASRSEYWWFFLFQLIVLVVTSQIHSVVYGIAALAMLLPGLGAGARRLHDVGRGGWWLLLYFIPLVGFLVLLYWMVQPSDPQDNAWGAPAAEPETLTGLPPGAQ